MSTPVLSICIATIPERSESFMALTSFLKSQAGFDRCEIISDAAPKGSISIGSKRQKMNESAIGDYVVHIDDDDWVAHDYIPSILSASESEPDCIGFWELVEGMAPAPQLAKWTIKSPKWVSGGISRRQGADYLRTPFHKTPIKRIHVMKVGFNDMGFGEDHDFSKRLQASHLCRKEVFIDKVLYFYRYVHNPSNSDKYGIR